MKKHWQTFERAKALDERTRNKPVEKMHPTRLYPGMERGSVESAIRRAESFEADKKGR